jgi:hypothetical protein
LSLYETHNHLPRVFTPVHRQHENNAESRLSNAFISERETAVSYQKGGVGEPTYLGEHRGRRDERSGLHNTGDEEACNVLIDTRFRALSAEILNSLLRTVQHFQGCI